MPLAPGSRLGAYEVVAAIGAGGMGEVYRARDTKLNRDVAIKVLPEAFALDADRLARFTREAQLLASLNHPNIAAIYGIEQNALVMELVDGLTLGELIDRAVDLAPSGSEARQAVGVGPHGKPRKDGGLPLDDALPIARQIADALEAAHEQGIIHRDLKPANIKVRDDGVVKVLDFGLAKALDPDAVSSSAAMNSPTLTARATQIGTILGTAAYMAPEQARGKAVDRRADIWAFGVVLYEMLTGRRAFDGDDISVTLANVIKDTPSWEALPVDVPAPVRRLLRRCLEKDPKRRLSAIGDARLELDEADSSSDVAPVGMTRTGLAHRERWIWASVAGVAALAVVALGVHSTFDAKPEAPLTVRFSVLPPGDGRFSGSPPRFAISPDGRSLVFAASPQLGKPEQLWLRRLDSPEVAPISGTEGVINAASPQSPFWSPDGRHLAFVVQNTVKGSQIRTLDLQGGGIQEVCDVPSNDAGGSWNTDGVILVASRATKGIQRVPASGGVPAPVTTLDESRNEVAHLWPQFLPDGRHFIYQAQTKARGDWAIFVGSLDSAERRKVVQSEYARFAAPNMLLYSKGENLLAQIMDPTTQELTGEPVVVATGLTSLITNGRAGFSVSDTGVLVYSSNPEQKAGAADRQLTWINRRGTAVGTVGVPVSSVMLRLSPDGTRVALLEDFPGRTGFASGSLWVQEVDRNVKTPLTPTRGEAASPTWSAGGSQLLFAVRQDKGDVVIAARAASGAAPATTLYGQAGMYVVPLDESADGKRVLFTTSKGATRSLNVLSRPDGKSTTYLTAEADRPEASLSRDGKWLAYSSDESGVYQIIVQPFPDPSRGKWQISTTGGLNPRWRRDGKELFYVDSEERLVAVSISASASGDLLPGRSTPLFSVPVVQRTPLGAAYAYDVAPDGQRFLVSLPVAGRASAQRAIPLTVTTAWTSLLTRK